MLLTFAHLLLKLTNLILSWSIVGVHHWWCHFPFSFVGWLVDFLHVLSQRENVNFDIILKIIVFVQLELGLFWLWNRLIVQFSYQTPRWGYIYIVSDI